MGDLFITAIRNKYRYPTERGELTTEDLWDVPLTSRDGFNLDAIAVGIYNTMDQSSISFVQHKTVANQLLANKLEVVKHIISVKLSDAAEAEAAELRREKKQKLLALKARKQDEVLANLTEEELDAELAKL